MHLGTELGGSRAAICCGWVAWLLYVRFFLMLRSHSISFTRAQDIPKYKLELGKGEDGRFGEGLVEGGP